MAAVDMARTIILRASLRCNAGLGRDAAADSGLDAGGGYMAVCISRIRCRLAS